MDENICFKLGDVLLITEQTLVIFDIPIFFICKDSNNNRYTVLCTDSINSTYIIVKSEAQDILDMLQGKMKMIDLFYKNEKCYYVAAGDDYTSDIINKRLTSELLPEELPEKEAYFALKTPEIEQYIDKLSNEAFVLYATNIDKTILYSEIYSELIKNFKITANLRVQHNLYKKFKFNNVINCLLNRNEMSINFSQKNHIERLDLSYFSPIVENYEVCCYEK